MEINEDQPYEKSKSYDSFIAHSSKGVRQATRILVETQRQAEERESFRWNKGRASGMV